MVVEVAVESYCLVRTAVPVPAVMRLMLWKLKMVTHTSYKPGKETIIRERVAKGWLRLSDFTFPFFCERAVFHLWSFNDDRTHLH